MHEMNFEIIENEKEIVGETKNKIGKKRIANRARNKNFALKFTSEELEEINEKTEKSKLSKTDFILKCVREEKIIVIEDLAKTAVEMRRHGINLNQIAKSINSISLKLKKEEHLEPGVKETIELFSAMIRGLVNSNKKILEELNKIYETVNE